ncbi:MAG: hypothetical protein M1327_05680 [Candidatus Thermoplasmatota archaeon]|nr:hypothetical protein [Candidatus Thermoplasmatota archaeon]
MAELKNETISLADIRGKLMLYPTGLDVFVQPQAIRFNGTAADFLSIASSLGVKFIYVASQGSISDSDNTVPESCGFIQDGFIHVFINKQNSTESSGKPDVHPTAANPDALTRMKQNPDEESKNMAMWVKSNLNYMSPDSFNLQYFFTKYWARLGIDRSATLDSENRTIIEQIEKMATAKIKSLK